MLVSKVARQTVPAIFAVRTMASSSPIGKEGRRESSSPAPAMKAERNEARRLRMQERIQRRKEEQDASVNRHMFTQRVDPLTGNVEWVVVTEQTGESGYTRLPQHSSEQSRDPLGITNGGEDWNDAVVQSSYLDMLNDGARNRAYAEAIRKVVQPGDLVLDIGTGTGLLSMLAAQALETKTTPLTSSHFRSNPNLNLAVAQTKADNLACPQIITCESFPPMARLAETVIQTNGMKDDIRVFNKRSDELTVGEGGELPRQADLLVSEILDSELLGEGLLPTLRDAWARLLRPGARTIPRRARVFAQLVECEFLRTCHDLSGREAGSPDGVRITVTPTGGVGVPGSGFRSGEACLGRGPPAWAVHADALGNGLKQLSAPFSVFDFDFAAPPSGDRHVALNVTSCADGTAHGLITWWSIDLDDEGLITYTTAPKYALSEADTCPYRGWHHHWRQCAWPFPSGGFRVLAGREVSVEATHDDLGIWYRARPGLKERPEGTSGAGAPRDPRSMTSAVTSAEPGRRKARSEGPVSLDGGPPDNHEVRITGGLAGSESGRSEKSAEASGRPKSGHVAGAKWSCSCGAHVKQTPERIGQLGDLVWRERLSSGVRKALASVMPDGRGMTSQERVVAAEDGRGKAAGGSHATCQRGIDSDAQPVQSEASNAKEESDREISVAADRTRIFGAQELEWRDCARQLSALAPVVVVADDSPLLPLLAAKHLSEIFGQRNSAQEVGTSSLPEKGSRSRESEASSENASEGKALSGWGFENRKSATTGPLDSSTLSGEIKADGVGGATLNGTTRSPEERNGSGAAEVRVLAREGPAAIEGLVETRAEASGIPTGFVPEQLPGRGGKISAEDLEGKKIVALFAEPWYSTCESGPPWAHALRFWHQRTVLDAAIAPSAPIIPCRAVLRGVAISAPELWESRRALARVEGFDHSAANRLLGACGLSAANSWDASDALGVSDFSDASAVSAVSDDLAAGCPVLPFPVWQCGASYQEVSEPFELLTFDFTEKLTSLERSAEVSLTGLGTCHGVALWMEYYSAGDQPPMLSTRWSPGDAPSVHKQGVQLFRLPVQPKTGGEVVHSGENVSKLRITASLDCRTGTVRLAAIAKEDTHQR